MIRKSANRDIIVIGASAGGVQALQLLVQDLPADLSAAVFIVLHIDGATSQLPEILNRAGELPVVQAKSGQRVERGCIYTAAPDRHLLLHDGQVLVRRGPHENRARPAVDPLFRSAACSFGARVIGVVLTGALDDGTAGLRAIKRCGGIAVIQDPADAAFPDMPSSAQRHVEINHSVPLAKLGVLLATLAAAPPGPTPAIPAEICLEAAIAMQELPNMTREHQIGDMSPFSCPECGGTLWELADGSMLRYRCHLGHAFSAETMVAAETGDVEWLLARLFRTHRDRAELLYRMAERERACQRNELATTLEARAQAYDEDAAVLRGLLPGRADSPGEDPAGDNYNQGKGGP
jgi:two-component system, chemotaxis family, protein-glutamate methylesterase/glutaminase